MRGSARGCESNGHLLKKWYKPITLDELRAYAVKHGVFDAEGKGFEPSTDKSAPDFESGKWTVPSVAQNTGFGGQIRNFGRNGAPGDHSGHRGDSRADFWRWAATLRPVKLPPKLSL